MTNVGIWYMTILCPRACNCLSLETDERLEKKRKTCSLIITDHKMMVDSEGLDEITDPAP